MLIPLNGNAKHSVLFVGDSHFRECANKTKDNLNKMYSVVGLVKPAADISTLSTSANNLVHTLTKLMSRFLRRNERCREI